MRAAANATAARNRNLHRRDSPRLRAQRGRPTRCDDGAGSGFARLLHQAFTIGTPFQGFSKWPSIIPGRCPGLVLWRPFGAGKSGASCRSPDSVIPRKRCASCRSPKGAIQPQPRATPWEPTHQLIKALKGRANIRAGFPSPKGAPQYQPRATPWETDSPTHQSPERAR